MKSIDELLNDYEEEFGGLPEEREPYASFLENQKWIRPRQESYILSAITLFSYIHGDRPIIGVDGEKRFINSVEDLLLLSIPSIIKNKGELYDAHYKISKKISLNMPTYRQLLHYIFNDPSIIKKLGKQANYDDDVGIGPEIPREDWPSVWGETYEKAYNTLKECVLGKIAVFDFKKDKGEEKFIKDFDDLYLLSSNLHHSKNIELSRAYRTIEDETRKWGSPNLIETLDRIFEETDVIAHLKGKANYHLNVKGFWSFELAYEIIMDTVLGKRPVIDRFTGGKVHINSKNDLTLLSNINIHAKDIEGNYLNPDLARAHYKIFKNEGNSIINKIFHEEKVIKHLGGVANREMDILIPNKKHENKDENQSHINNKPMETYIESPDLINRWIRYKEDGDETAKMELAEYYLDNLCINLCAKIWKDSYDDLQLFFPSPVDLIPYTYQALIKKIDEYDINRGISFIGFAYKRIKNAIIDGLREDKLFIREINGTRVQQAKIVYMDETVQDRGHKQNKYSFNGMDMLADTDHNDNLHLGEDMEILTNGLSKVQRMIIEGYLKGNKELQTRDELRNKGIVLQFSASMFSRHLKNAKEIISHNIKEVYNVNVNPTDF